MWFICFINHLFRNIFYCYLYEFSFIVHKAHKEELEFSLWILEQVLCLLPELIHKRWQLHSLSRIIMKLLHPGNTIKLRRQAIRYFLMWYQALNDNCPDYVHEIFANLLVPGFANNELNVNNPKRNNYYFNCYHSSTFHDTNVQNPINCCELLPILPPSAQERQPEQLSKLFLDTLLENMVVTVVRLDWHDKINQHHRCFQFLLEMFKVYYLPKLFPNFNNQTSLYRPNLGKLITITTLLALLKPYSLFYRITNFKKTRTRK